MVPREPERRPVPIEVEATTEPEPSVERMESVMEEMARLVVVALVVVERVMSSASRSGRSNSRRFRRRTR